VTGDLLALEQQHDREGNLNRTKENRAVKTKRNKRDFTLLVQSDRDQVAKILATI
jgi:hypothetical protein